MSKRVFQGTGKGNTVLRWMVRKALHEEMTSELTVVMGGGPAEEQGVSFGCWKMVNMTIVTKKGSQRKLEYCRQRVRP